MSQLAPPTDDRRFTRTTSNNCVVPSASEPSSSDEQQYSCYDWGGGGGGGGGGDTHSASYVHHHHQAGQSYPTPHPPPPYMTEEEDAELDYRFAVRCPSTRAGDVTFLLSHNTDPTTYHQPPVRVPAITMPTTSPSSKLLIPSLDFDLCDLSEMWEIEVHLIRKRSPVLPRARRKPNSAAMPTSAYDVVVGCMPRQPPLILHHRPQHHPYSPPPPPPPSASSLSCVGSPSGSREAYDASASSTSLSSTTARGGGRCESDSTNDSPRYYAAGAPSTSLASPALLVQPATSPSMTSPTPRSPHTTVATSSSFSPRLSSPSNSVNELSSKSRAANGYRVSRRGPPSPRQAPDQHGSDPAAAATSIAAVTPADTTPTSSAPISASSPKSRTTTVAEEWDDGTKSATSVASPTSAPALAPAVPPRSTEDHDLIAVWPWPQDNAATEQEIAEAEEAKRLAEPEEPFRQPEFEQRLAGKAEKRLRADQGDEARTDRREANEIKRLRLEELARLAEKLDQRPLQWQQGEEEEEEEDNGDEHKDKDTSRRRQAEQRPQKRTRIAERTAVTRRHTRHGVQMNEVAHHTAGSSSSSTPQSSVPHHTGKDFRITCTNNVCNLQANRECANQRCKTHCLDYQMNHPVEARRCTVTRHRVVAAAAAAPSSTTATTKAAVSFTGDTTTTSARVTTDTRHGVMCASPECTVASYPACSNRCCTKHCLNMQLLARINGDDAHVRCGLAKHRLAGPGGNNASEASTATARITEESETDSDGE